MENALNLGNLFAFSSEPVIIAENNVIQHMNPVALSRFGWEYMYKPVTRLIPEQVLDTDSKTFVASAQICDSIMTVTCSTVEQFKLYCFQMPEKQADETIIHSVSSAMRELTGGIKTNADLLRAYSMQADDPILQKYSAVLNHFTSKLKRLVNNYTLFADIKENKQQFKPEMYSVNEILKVISEEVTEITLPHNVRIYFHSDEDIRTALDRELIVQLLMNLISNSLTHMPNGGTIKLDVHTKNSFVVFTVEDNGTGISDDVLKNVFKAYTMPMNFGAGNFGIGLGMSVADSIAKLHGGSMIVESRQGIGTRITINIPHVTNVKFSSPKPEYAIPMRNSILTHLSTWLSWEDYLVDN